MYFAQTKGRITRFFLILLIIAFFVFPALAYTQHNHKIHIYSKKAASVLLVFFR